MQMLLRHMQEADNISLDSVENISPEKFQPHEDSHGDFSFEIELSQDEDELCSAEATKKRIFSKTVVEVVSSDDEEVHHRQYKK